MADTFRSELSEEQFKLIKSMCDSRVYVILAPHNMQGDSEEIRNGQVKNTTMLFDLVKQGFMENVTPEFAELLNKARAEGRRTFDAFCLTEMSIRMFSPKEGLVN